MDVHVRLGDHFITVVGLLRSGHLFLHDVRQQFSFQGVETLAAHQEVDHPLPQQVHMTVQQTTMNGDATVFA